MPEDRRVESAIDYYFGPYRVDGRLRRLYKDGAPVALTPKAIDTLVVLMQRAGRVVEKDELLQAVWGDVVVGEDTLAQNVSTLRRVFADDPNSPLFIATVPRRGYKFVAPVRAVPSHTGLESRAVLPPPLPARARSPAMVLLGIAALAAAFGGIAGRWTSVRSLPPASVQFTIGEPESGKFSAAGGMLSVSPDGAHLTFVVVDRTGAPSLWLRPLASAVARPLVGTEGAANPFWSPDSRTIAFFSERRLKAVDVTSGAVRVVASLGSARSMGGSWSRRNEILFSVPDDGMYLVAASGSSPQRLTPDSKPACADCGTWPQFLPDGRRFLYTVASSDTLAPGIYVGEIGRPGGERVLDAVSSCSYVAPGLLTYARAGTLYVQRFDIARLQLTGSPVPLADGVAYNVRTGRVLAAISESGVLAYRRALVTELVWMDRAGTPEGVVTPPGTYVDFAIAPDGARVAAARVDPRSGTSDIWVFDGEREIRVTDDEGSDGGPVWSEDGDHVAYASMRDGRWRIYRRQATALGPEALLLDADSPVTPLQILRSADLMYSARRPGLPFDVWRLRQEGPTPLAHVGGFTPSNAQLSPDERWLAYGRPEATGSTWSQTVYVSASPFGDSRRAVAEAASMPRWRADGRELFYLSKDSTIVSIPVDPDRTPSDAAGVPLFRVPGPAPTGISGQVYDVTRDGQRFLVKREVGSAAINVVLNWDARLDR